MASNFDRFMQALVGGVGQGLQGYGQGYAWRKGHEADEAERRRRAEEAERDRALRERQLTALEDDRRFDRESRLAAMLMPPGQHMAPYNENLVGPRQASDTPFEIGGQRYEYNQSPVTEAKMFTLPSGHQIPEDSTAYRQYVLGLEGMPGGSLYEPPMIGGGGAGGPTDAQQRLRLNEVRDYAMEETQRLYPGYGNADQMMSWNADQTAAAHNAYEQHFQAAKQYYGLGDDDAEMPPLSEEMLEEAAWDYVRGVDPIPVEAVAEMYGREAAVRYQQMITEREAQVAGGPQGPPTQEALGRQRLSSGILGAAQASSPLGMAATKVAPRIGEGISKEYQALLRILGGL